MKMVERDLIQQHSIDNPGPDNIRLYRTTRNQVNKMIDIDYKKYKMRILTDHQDNPRKRYEAARKITGWTKDEPPPRILSKGVLYTKAADIAEAMNTDYIEKNQGISDNLPHSPTDPMQHFKSKITTPDNKLEFNTITMQELRTILNRMRLTRSTGFDEISVDFIKRARKSLEPLIINLINQTLTHNKFTENLKNIKHFTYTKK